MSGAVLAAIIGGGVTAGGGVTPGPPNWPNISGIAVASTGNQQITGISAPISLKITWTGGGALSYSINGGSAINLTSGAAFTVNNMDQVNFTLRTAGTAGTVTVTNASDSNTVIDTFTYAIYALGPIIP